MLHAMLVTFCTTREVKLLLDAHADPNLLVDNMTPLQVLVQSTTLHATHKVEIAELLVRYGADPTVKFIKTD